jgi:hypothetical protein
MEKPVVPKGFSLVESGPVKYGDIGWNPAKDCWQEVAETAVIVGHPVTQYYAVARRVKKESPQTVSP